jgi:threonine dehydrogenase-like Zn-dependent dehydrogenase
MKAIVKQAAGPGNLAVAEWPDPVARPGQVVVDIAVGGICSTDVAIYAGTYKGRRELRYPTMVGHEAAGIVTAAAEDVDDVAVGDRVALQVIWGHPHAWQSLIGHENLDPDWIHIGASALGGTFAERIAVPADRVLRLPDDVDWESAALLEPLAVAAHAMDLVRIAPGESLVIVGPGQFGLLMLLIARAAGAGPIAVMGLAGVDDARLARAGELGADALIACTGDLAAVDAAIRAAVGPDGADVVQDCGGTAESTTIALDAAAPAGRVGIFGFTPRVEIEPLRQIIRKGLTLHGVSAAQRRHYAIALRMIERGAVDPRRIVSHRLPVWEAEEGLRLVQSRAATKVLLETPVG